jgi:hypothetical protein
VTTSSPAPERREAPAWLALLFFLLLGALPVRDALLDPAGSQLLATDTATSQLPWSAHLVASGIRPDVANAEISDQGVVFHPYLRWVVRSWLAGDPPLWNPLVYLGAPGIGNPQARVIDPQVLALVALEAVFGEVGFRAGLAVNAWLRLALGCFGAFLLARRLGLVGAAPWIAGVSFGLSAFTVLWLGSPLGAVPVFLPWTLLAIEALRGPRARLAFAAVALTTAGSILAGHPETSFYCGALCGLWSLALLREQRRAGLFALVGLFCGALLAAPMLVPFVEYLGNSAAKSIRAAKDTHLAWGDLLPLVPLVASALVWRATRRRSALQREIARSLALVVGAVGFVAAGLPSASVLTFAPGLFGRPGGGTGYLGPGSYLEEASAFAPLAVFVLAAATAIAGGGPLRRRGLVLVTTALAWWLALRAPGLLELKQQVPLVGLGATVRLAPVAALGLALLAAEGWQHTPWRARSLALVAVATVALPLALPPSHPATGLPSSSVASEELFVAIAPTVDERGVLVGRRIDVEGALQLAPGEQVFLELVGAHGSESPAALDVFDEPSAAARAALGTRESPTGVRWFRSPYLDASRLAEGRWRADVAVLAADGHSVRARATFAAFSVERERTIDFGLVLCVALALALPFLAPAKQPALSCLFVVFLALRLVDFANGQNPATPLERVYPLTATEEVLLEHMGSARVFSDAGVFPPNTALAHGIASVAGYDGMEPLAHAQWVPFVLPPGAHPLLSWNARGIDPDATLFQMSGCRFLALAAPRDVPGWSVVAGPGPDAPRFAEVTILRRDDAPRRAFVARGALSLPELGQVVRADPHFDPTRAAAFSLDWAPTTPCTQAVVGEPTFTNTTVEVDVELDGDGLFVLGESWFPGWRVLVDGEERPLGIANGVFRGVALEAGAHRVRFVYRPTSLVLGLSLAAVGLGLLVLGLAAVRRGASVEGAV